jgi:hypothetical protein
LNRSVSLVRVSTVLGFVACVSAACGGSLGGATSGADTAGPDGGAATTDASSTTLDAGTTTDASRTTDAAGAGTADAGASADASATTADASTTTSAQGVACSGVGAAGCALGFECIPNAASRGTFVCAGQPGTLCTADGQCVSGHCQSTAHDCFFPHSCDNAPSYCTAVVMGKGVACYSDADCGAMYGCENHLCCGAAKQACSTDADCCSGLQCHTDNTGCGVGPTPTCTIDGQVYASGAPNPASPECQYCNPYIHTDTWTDSGAYRRCGSATATTPSYCCNGACSAAPICNAPGNGADH